MPCGTLAKGLLWLKFPLSIPIEQSVGYIETAISILKECLSAYCDLPTPGLYRSLEAERPGCYAAQLGVLVVRSRQEM